MSPELQGERRERRGGLGEESAECRVQSGEPGFVFDYAVASPETGTQRPEGNAERGLRD